MGFVHRDGGETVLEKMPAPAPSRVDERGVASMRIAQCPRETRGVVWRENEVNVVWHEAIGPDLDRRFAAMFGEKIAIDFLVADLEENGLAPIAALGNVMRTSGDDDASETSHDQNISPRALSA